MAVAAMGTKLMIGANSVAELKGIGGLDISADTIETTTLDAANGFRTFIQGLKDAGEVSINGYLNAGDTNGQIALYNALTNGTLLNLSILFPSTLGASWSFNGVVTGFKTDAQMEDVIPFEATIKVSGAPTLGLTPSAGLSALTVIGAGGSLTPAFSNGKYFYTYSGVTATNVTVTATAANHTLQLFVNGVFVQNLTSGTASNAIALASIGDVAEILITAQENNKTQKLYEVRAVKTA